MGSFDLTGPSKFFVGGGFVVSTINNEGFVHLGSNPVDIGFSDPQCLREFCFGSVGAGGMVRYGVVLPSVHFDDLTTDYLQTQAVVDLNGVIIDRCSGLHRNGSVKDYG